MCNPKFGDGAVLHKLSIIMFIPLILVKFNTYNDYSSVHIEIDVADIIILLVVCVTL